MGKTAIMRDVDRSFQNICRRSKVPYPSSKVKVLKKKLEQYLSEEEHLDNSALSAESKDRRFVLTAKKNLVFHGRDASYSISLLKALASLCLSKQHLYTFLINKTKGKSNIQKFTIKEKTLLKNLVRLAGIRKNNVPCIPLRSFL